jgi:hypothetical protein
MSEEMHGKRAIFALSVITKSHLGLKEADTMKRYFDLPDAKLTLLVEVKPGSPAALASPERIKDHFKQKRCYT